ncbi:DUF3397 domain-containing protein [Paenibacillus thermoaerophilus]|uniref:DUF3397 domain-containing protein n=1 Tax=Paenibacillus thermoaerophilus TaxID=1215385 RepID=A0ABW2V1L3_9BACL|nr:DUF3397 domain-containing protein [Paenibacillus thermoaerophilus]TMV19062.1 DUF3397 domain-containing protein [Paenibacillus thermoaerophilus]
MSAIWEWIAEFYALLAAVPFAVFAAVWAGVCALTRDKKRAGRAAIDVTTALLLGTVYGLMEMVWGTTFPFFALILVLLVLFGLIGNAQMKAKGRMNARRAFQFVWRIAFMAMAPIYVILMAVGLWQYTAA